MPSAILLPAWFLIAAFFTYLAYVHWRMAQSPLREFVFRDRDEKGEQPSEGGELSPELIKDFNKYLEKTNKEFQSRNQRAAIWYFVAAFVAVLSLFLTNPFS